ncbi:MAG: cupin domain-containing protein [Mycobacteriales bacterium]
MSALARCVGDADLAGRYWGRAPLLTRAAGGFADLLGPDDVDDLVASRALRTPFFRTVADGSGQPDPVRSVTAGNRRIGDVVDPDRLHAQRDAGATLVLQALHRLHPPVGAFCRELAEELGHPTQCNAYLTPGGQSQGFAWHHDTHDVLVLQVSGRKHWRVHAPVLPQPLSSQPRAGADLVGDDAEPVLDVVLEPGDCLYLPRGFVHAARTTDEASVHLTVGILTTTAFDVLGDALSLAAQEERFRASLPARPLDALPELLPDLLREAAAWLEKLPADEVAEVVRARLARAVPPEPLRPLAQAAAVDALAAHSRVRPRGGLPVTVTEDGERVVVAVPGKQVSLPVAAAPAVRRALAQPVRADDLVADGLTPEEGGVVLRRLLREGVLLPG